MKKEFKCACHNSGTNSYTGKCDRCGMTKPSHGTNISNNSIPYKTVHENEVMINPPKEEFFIFNAGSINGRPFTEGEKKELEETKKAFYEKYSAQNFEEDI